MIEIGSKAPDFELMDDSATVRTLADFAGKKLVLYFYSKDNTSGCTAQACAFAELYPAFIEKGASVVGVSKDTPASHKKFKEKYGLPFVLLSDPTCSLAQAYGIYKERTRCGRTSMVTVRSTFLISEDGYVERAFVNVKAKENPGRMLEALKEC